MWGLPGRGNGCGCHARDTTVAGDEDRGPTVGHGSAASLLSLRLLRGSRPANLVGLYMNLVSSPQLLEKHKVVPPFDPHAGPDGQDHRAAVLPRQYDRALA